MNKKILVPAVVLLALFGAVFLLLWPSDSARPVNRESEVLQKFLNQEFPEDSGIISEGAFKLTDGSYIYALCYGKAVTEEYCAQKEHQTEASVVLAKESVVVEKGKSTYKVAGIVASNSGGSGVYEDLVLLEGTDGSHSLKYLASFSLGDRIKVNSISIEGDKVLVDMLVHGEGSRFQGMCCPNVRMVKKLQLIGGRLELVEYFEKQETTQGAFEVKNAMILYNNNTLQFSLFVPKAVSVPGCAADVREQVGIKTFEDATGVYIAPEYVYRAEYRDGKAVSCERIAANPGGLKEEPSGWRVDVFDAKDKQGVERYVQERYGSGCYVKDMLKKRLSGTYDITVEDSMTSGKECLFNRIAVKIWYSPQLSKGAAVAIGHEGAFQRDGVSHEPVFDFEMAESFRFAK